MANLTDIVNETIRHEIEEYIERPNEVERNVELFARIRPLMQKISAALIEGDDGTVDRLTKQALDENISALEIMDDGLISGMGIVGIKFRDNFIFVPEVLACARAMRAGMGRRKQGSGVGDATTTTAREQMPHAASERWITRRWPPFPGQLDRNASARGADPTLRCSVRPAQGRGI